MANGLHWEWRAFGQVGDDIRQALGKIPLKFEVPWDNTTDEYLWIPGCEINVKLRSGGQQQGLKLKRLVRSDRDMEMWLEDPKELYPFATLDGNRLRQLADKLGLTLSTVLPGPPTQDSTLTALTHASPAPTVVTIVKRRQTRQVTEDIQIELAEITSVTVAGTPVPLQASMSSLGIENSVDLTAADPARVAKARDAVEALISTLRLRREGLCQMNYLRLIAGWLSTTR